MSPLAQAFLDICVEEDSTASVEAIRNKALQKIAAGEGKTLVGTTVNSKSFNFSVTLPAKEMFSQASAAIRVFNGRGIGSTVEFNWAAL